MAHVVIVPERLQHARARRARVLPVVLAGVVAIGALVASVSLAAAGRGEPDAAPTPPLPQTAMVIPAPVDGAVVLRPSPCDDPVVTAALADGTDAEVIAAVGGALRFREVIVNGEAPCIPLNDANRSWVVVNKVSPFADLEYAPNDLAALAVQSINGHQLRGDAQRALDEMADASVASGAGRVALLSGYRSYGLQVSVHERMIAAEGREQTEATSARPGYSEHQTGLAADLIACDGACGSMDDFGGTSQGQFVRDHGWEYGFIIRYEDGYQGTTGYLSEPWHVRYVGVEIATAYHEGGYRTLEEFFGLPAAPDYRD